MRFCKIDVKTEPYGRVESLIRCSNYGRNSLFFSAEGYRKIVDGAVFDSDAVDNGHLFSRYYNSSCYYPSLRPPLLYRDEYFWAVHLKDNQNRIFSKKIILFFLELTKFAAQNIGQMKDVVFKDEGMKWAFILENMHKMGEQDLSGEDEMFQQMFEDCRISKLTTMEKKAYRKSILDFADVRDAVKVAQQRGEERGYEQGVQQGKEKALLQTARNLLELGLPLADVVKATGLSEEEILAHVGNTGF